MSGRNHAAVGGCEVQRLDKWLWFVRAVKSRTLAAALVAEGKVRVNRERASKPSHALRVGDVVTLTVHAQVRVLKVLSTGVRRGPPVEARGLYEDLTPEATSKPGARESESRAIGPPGPVGRRPRARGQQPRKVER
jgi:ribosome-associated heat shock protein Hsp15